MSGFLIFDPLFRVPFFTGLFLAAALSFIGSFLNMRDEWLSALGLAHLAAAGGIAALPLGLPVMFTAALAASLGAAVKASLPKSGNSHYGLMILAGWSGALIIAANSSQGEVIGEALLRGQLYFASTGHLAAAAVLLAILILSAGWLSPRLLKERFFPDYYSANGLPAWRHRFLFSAMVVFAAVLGTISMGAFPAFAIFFIPSWTASVIVDGWRRSLIASVFIGCSVYLISFYVAVTFDQPFGPVLVFCAVMTASLRPLCAILRKA